MTSWRFYSRAWQPQRHDRLPETSGTLWIHRGALTNQRCSLATGCGIKHWKPSRGAPMRFFGTNNCLLIYALCVIFATGHWGTPHYYQLATEEWLHFTARWWTWNTLNIENHLRWPRWVIFDHIIQSRCLSYSGDSQPASEERPITLKRPLRNGDCMGPQGTLNIENHV